MKINFEYFTNLQYENKALRARIAALESGEKYVRLKDEYEQRLREKDRELRQVKAQLEECRRQIVLNREKWFRTCEELEKEYQKKLRKKQTAYDRMQKLWKETSVSCNSWREKYLEQLKLRYKAETELEEEKGKNVKLRARLNRDYENSSIPSSLSRNRRKIANSREKTGRVPGGQPGHKGHGRKKQEPTKPPVLLPPPQEVLEDPDFKKTGNTIIKQLVSIRLVMDVNEYHADVYYNSRTGERMHAAFPEGVADDVNYDGSIKAFLFLLNNECCTSIDKSRKFLSDLTGGKLNISKGMISRNAKRYMRICCFLLSCIQTVPMQG